MSAPAEIAFPPALFEKRKFNEKAVPRWEIALLFGPDHPDLKPMKDLCRRIAESEQAGITKDPKAWKYPWSNADDFIAKQAAKEDDKKRDNEFMRGKVLFNSHTAQYEPLLSVNMPERGIVDFRGELRATVKDKFYAGCMVFCEFSLVWYPPGNGLPGVTAYLNKVCSLNKGERRGGARSGAEVFGAYIGKLSATDPTAGADADY